jgi:hypothetical protein
MVLGGRRGAWPRVARWSSFTKFGAMAADVALIAAAAGPSDPSGS